VLNAGEDVLHLDVVLLADEIGSELVTVAGAAAVIRAQHSVALRGEVQSAVVRVEAEVVVAGGRRPAVDCNDQRQWLIALLPAVRKFERPADWGAVGRFPGDVLNGGEFPGFGVGVRIDEKPLAEFADR
jgi:hypothetical protein